MDEAVHVAAQALGRAGRWDVAVALLDRWATPTDAHDVALLRADLLADKAFWTSTPVPPTPPSAADDTRGPGTIDWQASWSRARASYTTLLQDRLSGRGVDRAAARDLLARLDRLRALAPDDAAELAVRFHLGLVHENLLGNAAAATPHWTAAARSPVSDTAAAALRHLGGQHADAGDHALARDMWRESFRLRARDGDLPGALAQLALLAPSTPLDEALTLWVEAAGLAVLRDRGTSGSS